MKSNTKFTVLRTQAPERKGSTGLDTNHYRIKNRLTVALGYTYSSEKWNMWKLILWHSFGKWVHIDSQSTQFKHSDWSLSEHTRSPSQWSDEMLMLDMLCWLVLGMSMIYKTPMRLWEDVCFPPLTSGSNLRQVSVIGLYHSAPYWQKHSLITALEVNNDR